MSALQVILENFDDADFLKNGSSAGRPDARLQREKAAAYAEGYAAGETAAKANNDFLQETANCVDAALADLPDRVNALVCDALAMAIEKLFPRLAEAGFADEAAATVLAAANISDDAAIIVKASPDQVGLLQDAFAGARRDGSITVEADQDLADFEISAEWKDAGVEFNFTKAADEIGKALEKTAKQLRSGKRS